MAIGKMIDPSLAASAYSNTAKSNAGAKIGGDDGVSFSDFMKDTIGNTLDTMKNSEATSAKAVTGEADITDVVQAVTDAELTLQTVIAMRDRLVASYQEIMRMPV